MAVHSEGVNVFVGDGQSPEGFTDELALIEVPEFFGASVSTYSNRTTADTGKTKKYGLGLEDGEELGLVCEHDFDNTAQGKLRTAHKARDEISIAIKVTDGTTTEFVKAPFLVTSTPITRADPNGDGETDKQTFNVKRNGDWVDVA